MIANYHTHTFRCNHATGEDREYVEKAIERGLKVLGFSDHCPQFFPTDHYSGFRMRPDKMDDYVTSVLDLRREYKNDIDIKLGLEIEYYPEIFGKLDEFLAQYPLEYYILGQHFIHNEYDTHISSGWAEHDDDMLKNYTDEILEALGTGKFTYLAHPDLFAYSGSDELYRSEAIRLCEGAKALGIPLEVNFLGLAEGRIYPCDRFFKIATEVGCDFVLGCDAHNPKDIMLPETVAKVDEFIKRNNITPLENITLRNPKW